MTQPFFINENLSPSKNLEWGIRIGYINKLRELGISEKFIQKCLPTMTNDMMCDIIRGMAKIKEELAKKDNSIEWKGYV